MAIDNQETVREIKPKGRRIMGAGGPEGEENNWPPWLKSMLTEEFFLHCKVHANSHKNECNMYCLDCMNGPFCSNCLEIHKDHRAIQIRKSSYHNAVRVCEIQKFLDLSYVQTYVINSAKIVFLKERPQPKPGKGVTNSCEVCERGLLDSFKYCSLGCKVVGTSPNFQKRKSQFSENTFPAMAASEWEDSYKSSHGNARDHIPKNSKSKVQNFIPSTPPQTAASFRSTKRRKGTPHRAPMGSGLLIDY